MLDSLLAMLRIDIETFATCRLAADWRLAFGAEEHPSLHYVLAGQGTLSIACGPALALFPGLFVIQPAGLPGSYTHGDGRAGLAHGELRAVPAGGTVPEALAGQGPDELVVACGLLRATIADVLPLFARLEQPLVMNFAEESWLGGKLRDLLADLGARRPGTRAATEALLTYCLTEFLRRHVPEAASLPPWLAVLRDTRLIPALAAMTARPAHRFTLEELAAIAGMSRSSFAAAFRAALGIPPMAALRDIRLRRAHDMLAQRRLSVAAAARAAGFGSRSHFSRAFQEKFGRDPSSVREAAVTG